MSFEPRAALLVVISEDDPDCFVAAAFTDEAVRMAVCGSASDRNSSCAKLLVESPSGVWSLRHYLFLPNLHHDYRARDLRGEQSPLQPVTAS